jgi:hypothetical protein
VGIEMGCESNLCNNNDDGGGWQAKKKMMKLVQ